MNRFLRAFAVIVGVLLFASLASAQKVTSQPCTNQVGYQDFNSTAVDLSNVKYGSVQFVWTGLTGMLNASVKIQVSDNSGTNYQDKDGSTQPITVNAGNYVFSLINVTEQFYRVVYLHGGVTGGTFNCYLLGKP